MNFYRSVLEQPFLQNCGRFSLRIAVVLVCSPVGVVARISKLAYDSWLQQAEAREVSRLSSALTNRKWCVGLGDV